MPRPPKPPGTHYRTPVRQLGRVSDADWQMMRKAAAKKGVTFTQWACETLMRAAKRQLR